ncbi:hypothetical protein C8R44DRAFT_885431 [Mycena epipterygia]|nr:hypothetical protein C8R44DRAFT_885431 [Mycena epipterygia]
MASQESPLSIRMQRDETNMYVSPSRDKLATLQSHRAAIAADREALRAHHAGCTAMLSPIRSLHSSTRIATALLVGALERGGNSLMTVEVTIDEHSPPEPALSLLTAHSARWQAVSVTCEGAFMRRLAAVKHRLPRLESLRL